MRIIGMNIIAKSIQFFILFVGGFSCLAVFLSAGAYSNDGNGSNTNAGNGNGNLAVGGIEIAFANSVAN